MVAEEGLCFSVSRILWKARPSCGSRKNLRVHSHYSLIFRPRRQTALPVSATGGGRVLSPSSYARRTHNLKPQIKPQNQRSVCGTQNRLNASLDAIDFDRCTLTPSLPLPQAALRRFALREPEARFINFP